LVNSKSDIWSFYFLLTLKYADDFKSLFCWKKSSHCLNVHLKKLKLAFFVILQLQVYQFYSETARFKTKLKFSLSTELWWKWGCNFFFLLFSWLPLILLPDVFLSFSILIWKKTFWHIFLRIILIFDFFFFERIF